MYIKITIYHYYILLYTIYIMYCWRMGQPPPQWDYFAQDIPDNLGNTQGFYSDDKEYVDF